MTYREIIIMITEELQSACKKFPEWPEDPIHAVAIVNEEAGEAVKATLQWVYEPSKGTKWEDIEGELIQTAAMAIRMIKNYKYYERLKTQSFRIIPDESYEIAMPI